MSVCLSTVLYLLYLSVCLYVILNACLSLNCTLAICLSVCLSVCQPVCLSVCLSASLQLQQFVVSLFDGMQIGAGSVARYSQTAVVKFAKSPTVMANFLTCQSEEQLGTLLQFLWQSSDARVMLAQFVYL